MKIHKGMSAHKSADLIRSLRQAAPPGEEDPERVANLTDNIMRAVRQEQRRRQPVALFRHWRPAFVSLLAVVLIATSLFLLRPPPPTHSGLQALAPQQVALLLEHMEGLQHYDTIRALDALIQALE